MRRCLGLMLCVGLMGASPGRADEIDQTLLSPPNGVRETTSDGFALLEHNVWPVAESRVDWVKPLSIGRPLPRVGSPRRALFLPRIHIAEARHRLPSGLLDALIWAESSYNPFAISPAGAVGLAQLMPATARDLGVANRYDADANIDGGARYLRQMLDRFGKVHLAVAAYNAGPNAIARARGIPLNGETPAYVAKVMRRWVLAGSAPN
jgi:soluble lytic murein transglycosylase-like protein